MAVSENGRGEEEDETAASVSAAGDAAMAAAPEVEEDMLPLRRYKSEPRDFISCPHRPS